MYLSEFLDNIDNFNDSKVQFVFTELIEALSIIEGTASPEDKRFVLEQLAYGLKVLESDDFFGTEGLQV